MAAFLQVTMKVDEADRPAAAEVYRKYLRPFLDTVPGATSKQLLVRDDDVQVLHGFDTTEHADGYLSSDLFKADVVGELSSLLAAAPEIRIYQVA